MDEVHLMFLALCETPSCRLASFLFSIVLDDCRIMKIGHIHIYITADAVDPAFVPMLSDAAAARRMTVSAFSL